MLRRFWRWLRRDSVVVLSDPRSVRVHGYDEAQIARLIAFAKMHGLILADGSLLDLDEDELGYCEFGDC